jgi:hypothetical protein
MIKHIPAEDRAEYEELLAEVVANHEGTGDRAAALAAGLADGVQAHRQWAINAEQAALLDGCAEEVKRYLKRSRVVVNVGNDKKPRKVTKSRVIGTKRLDGQKWIDVQLPFEALTWDDLRAKQRECAKARESYADTIGLLRRLLDLETQAPGTTGPAEAAGSLGIELDDWLADSA